MDSAFQGKRELPRCCADLQVVQSQPSLGNGRTPSGSVGRGQQVVRPSKSVRRGSIWTGRNPSLEGDGQVVSPQVVLASVALRCLLLI